MLAEHWSDVYYLLYKNNNNLSSKNVFLVRFLFCVCVQELVLS